MGRLDSKGEHLYLPNLLSNVFVDSCVGTWYIGRSRMSVASVYALVKRHSLMYW